MSKDKLLTTTIRLTVSQRQRLAEIAQQEDRDISWLLRAAADQMIAAREQRDAKGKKRRVQPTPCGR